MKILVLNAGSSSLKFQLLQMPEGQVLIKGLVEEIGRHNSAYSWQENGEKQSQKKSLSSMKEAFDLVKTLLGTHTPQAIGHRVVHGGTKYASSVLINEQVKEAIAKNAAWAPLHNPSNLLGIELSEKAFPAIPQVAVFDTSFHQTIPAVAARYAIPRKLFEQERIRVYGFHGTSHQYVVKKCTVILGYLPSKVLSLHLGNGCSITAIKDGESMDHSLGISPGTGLIMGTRSGDIDHALIFHLINHKGYTPEGVNDLLNRESGLKGLTGSSDFREVEKMASQGNRTAKLALEMVAYRIKKYIGAYTAALNGLDVLIFTAGIGENSPLLREMVCQEMDYLGIHLDKEKNEAAKMEIQKENARVKLMVIPTNEELEIAQQAYKLCL